MNKAIILGLAGALAVVLVVGIMKVGTRQAAKTEVNYSVPTQPAVQKSPSSPPDTTSSEPENIGTYEGVHSAVLLEDVTPADGTIVKTAAVKVAGRSYPDAEVSINDKNVVADKKGYFGVTVNLDEGENVISIVANDAEGNYAEQELTVSYNP